MQGQDQVGKIEQADEFMQGQGQVSEIERAEEFMQGQDQVGEVEQADKVMVMHWQGQNEIDMIKQDSCDIMQVCTDLLLTKQGQDSKIKQDYHGIKQTSTDLLPVEKGVPGVSRKTQDAPTTKPKTCIIKSST
eukprot:2494718-Rhodomonas_salina.3